MLRAKELRILSEPELEDKLRELKETLFNLRFQHATGQLDNPMRIKETKRDIARVCTLMTERRYSIHAEAFEEALAEPLVRDVEEPEELAEEAGEPEEEGLAYGVEESEEQLEEEVEEELRDL